LLDRFGLWGRLGRAMFPPPMPELSVSDDSGIAAMRKPPGRLSNSSRKSQHLFILWRLIILSRQIIVN
jgi:hypothetical protein